MKYFFHKTIVAAILVMLVSGCTKEENKVYFEGATAPVLTASVSEIPVLSVATKNNPALTLSWTNPNYEMTTGVSSQDVRYTLEIDTVGADFKGANKQQISIAKDLSTSMTVSELNGYLTKMELAADMPHDLEVRVISSINGAVPYTSNVLQFMDVIPYEDFAILPPESNELFIVGSATPGGWDNPVPDPAQKLTTVSKGLYEITLNLTAGGSFLFLPKNGDWGAKYGGAGSANNSNNPDGDAFKAGGSDLIAPAASGMYKITVDFKTGKFKVVKQ